MSVKIALLIYPDGDEYMFKFVKEMVNKWIENNNRSPLQKKSAIVTLNFGDDELQTPAKAALAMISATHIIKGEKHIYFTVPVSIAIHSDFKKALDYLYNRHVNFLNCFLDNETDKKITVVDWRRNAIVCRIKPVDDMKTQVNAVSDRIVTHPYTQQILYFTLEGFYSQPEVIYSSSEEEEH